MLSGTFPQIFTLFQTFQNFAPRPYLRIKGFYYRFSSKRTKDNKNMKTKPFLHVSCRMFVLLRVLAL